MVCEVWEFTILTFIHITNLSIYATIMNSWKCLFFHLITKFYLCKSDRQKTTQTLLLTILRALLNVQNSENFFGQSCIFFWELFIIFALPPFLLTPRLFVGHEGQKPGYTGACLCVHRCLLGTTVGWSL